MFELSTIKEIDENTTEVTLFLEDDEESRKIWNFSFRLEVIFRLGESLSVSIKTTNTDANEFMITQALHTYFGVSDISKATIEGLDNCSYLDTLTDEKELQNGDISINSECDRVYQEVKKDILLKDKSRVVSISSQGSSSAVVWNPWIEKGSEMSGM